MNGYVTRKRKSRWFRMTVGVLGVWFILQVNPAFCACLTEVLGAAVTDEAPSGRSTCHSTLPAESSHPKAPESGSKSSDCCADTCPLCHCLATESVGHHTYIAASSSGFSPILSACEVPVKPNGFLSLRSYTCSDPPLVTVRSVPLFVRNSAFLL